MQKLSFVAVVDIVSHAEVTLVYQWPVYIAHVTTKQNKKTLFPGTPQWIIYLKQFLELFSPKTSMDTFNMKKPVRI